MTKSLMVNLEICKYPILVEYFMSINVNIAKNWPNIGFVLEIV